MTTNATPSRRPRGRPWSARRFSPAFPRRPSPGRAPAPRTRSSRAKRSPACACPRPGLWNGDLVVFAHGYVSPEEPVGIPEDQLSLPDGTSLPGIVNALGFGFATTSYSKNGLAVLPGVADVRDVVDVFVDEQGPPRHTYLVGASEGGLVTALAVERSPEVFSGGVAACGPVGDFRRQINYWGDFRALFDLYFPGLLPGDAVHVPQSVRDEWTSTYVPRITMAFAARPAALDQLLRVSRAPFDAAGQRHQGGDRARPALVRRLRHHGRDRDARRPALRQHDAVLHGLGQRLPAQPPREALPGEPRGPAGDRGQLPDQRTARGAARDAAHDRRPDRPLRARAALHAEGAPRGLGRPARQPAGRPLRPLQASRRPRLSWPSACSCWRWRGRTCPTPSRRSRPRRPASGTGRSPGRAACGADAHELDDGGRFVGAPRRGAGGLRRARPQDGGERAGPRVVGDRRALPARPRRWRSSCSACCSTTGPGATARAGRSSWAARSSAARSTPWRSARRAGWVRSPRSAASCMMLGWLLLALHARS